MHTQQSPMKLTYQPADKVIPFPGNKDNHAKLATASALWAAFDSGVFAALRDVQLGPASQAIYTALIRRLPNVRPGLTRLASDTGLKRCTVLRVLNTLDTIGLVRRHRSNTDVGDSDTTVYELADLRNPEVTTQCHAQIRKLMKKQVPSSSKGGRCTSAPTSSEGGRCVDAPTGRRTGAPGVGAPVRPKDTKKKQPKQQEALPLVGGGEVDNFRGEIIDALRRWGITNPAYLLDPANKSSIPELIQHPHEAVRLIDKAMRLRQWTDDCGPGLRVSHLHSHIREAAQLLEADRRAHEIRHNKLVARARTVIDQIPVCDESGVNDLSADRYEELLKKGLDALAQRDDVVGLIITDEAACRRVIARELEKERLGSQLDAMDDDDVDLLKQELLARIPTIRSFFRNTDPRSKTLRGSLIEQLRIRRAVAQ